MSAGTSSPAPAFARRQIRVGGHEAPFGVDLIFRSTGSVRLTFHVEICEDFWVPLPPSTGAALAGAEVLVNLSASNVTIGKAETRRLLCASQSARAIAAYAYSAAGPGESTTDLAWDGHAAIFECGDRLAETERFPLEFDLHHRRCRPRPHSPGADARQHLRRLRPRGSGPCGRIPDEHLRAARARGAGAAPARRRALSVRSRRPDKTPRELLRGLQHPGPGPRHAPAGDGNRTGGHRRVRRPRLDAGADRRGARHGPARPPARERARLHAARLSPPPSTPRATPGR